MIGGIIITTTIACVALLFASSAWNAHDQAKKHREAARRDLEASQRIHAATAEHVRDTVLRKPFDVPERKPQRFGLVLDPHHGAVEFTIPDGSHPVFGRGPRGVS